MNWHNFSNTSWTLSLPHENDVEERLIEFYRSKNHYQCSSVHNPNFQVSFFYSEAITLASSHSSSCVRLFRRGWSANWTSGAVMSTHTHTHQHTNKNTQAHGFTHTLTGSSAQSAMLLECKDALMMRKERGKESCTDDLLSTFFNKGMFFVYMYI